MVFENLKERMLYYRSLSDYKLLPNTYVLAMIDGHCFSSLIKKHFKRPFDEVFINAMNETARYVCHEIQGIKLAYVQSDEVSFVITDFDTLQTDSMFGYRLCKLNSLIASTATAKFNQIIYQHNLEHNQEQTLYTFDCKAWNVPTENDVYAWFLYRQLDCVRNSKNQAAQTYLSHNALVGKNSDDAIALLKETKGISWNDDYNDGEKYGRFIYKTDVEVKPGCIRKKYDVQNAFPLNGDEGKERIMAMMSLPKLT